MTKRNEKQQAQERLLERFTWRKEDIRIVVDPKKDEADRKRREQKRQKKGR